MHTFSHHPYCHTGSAAENDVTQTPGILWKHDGDSAEMNCSHTKGAQYFQMYWYRQRQGETLSLVVFTTLGGENSLETSIRVNIPLLKLRLIRDH